MRNLKHEKIYIDIFKKGLKNAFSQNLSKSYMEYEIYTNLHKSICKEVGKLSSKKMLMLVKDERTKGFPLNPLLNYDVMPFFYPIEKKTYGSKYIYSNKDVDNIFKEMKRKEIRSVVKYTLHIVAGQVVSHYSSSPKKIKNFLLKAKGVYLYSLISRHSNSYTPNSFSIMIREKSIQNKIANMICKDNSKRLNNALTRCLYSLDHICNFFENDYASKRILLQKIHYWFLSNPESILDENFDIKYFYYSKGYRNWSESWDISRMNCFKIKESLSKLSYRQKKRKLGRLIDILSDENIIDDKGIISVAREGALSLISYLKREDLLFFIGICNDDHNVYYLGMRIKEKLSLGV